MQSPATRFSLVTTIDATKTLHWATSGIIVGENEGGDSLNKLGRTETCRIK